MLTRKYLDELTLEIIGSAIDVPKEVGRGLLESVYHQCLMEELRHGKINFQTEMKVPIIYREKFLDIEFRCDLFVEQCIVIVLKSVHEMVAVFEAQLLTYMKLLQCPKEILINFNTSNIFREGQKTFVNEFFRTLPDR